MDLLSHNAILLAQNLDLIVVLHHFLQLCVFFLKNQQLLMEIMSTTFTLKVQDILKMLDLLLKLCYKGIISGTYLVLTDFGHDLFSPIGELQGRDGLL